MQVSFGMKRAFPYGIDSMRLMLLQMAASDKHVARRAQSIFLIEKLVQHNPRPNNLVTSGKKGSNNAHLIIAGHNLCATSE